MVEHLNIDPPFVEKIKKIQVGSKELFWYL